MELTIIVAIIAFLVVTLLLVGLLLFAKAKLTSSGEVTIDINGGEKVITTESGSTLLATLANNKVFLPSACGGGGSCGMCKCQVIEGGGDILPTETGFITRKMAKEHWRLGCQVKVKENLKIQVPEAVLGVKKWECTVVKLLFHSSCVRRWPQNHRGQRGKSLTSCIWYNTPSPLPEGIREFSLRSRTADLPCLFRFWQCVPEKRQLFEPAHFGLVPLWSSAF